VLCSIGIAELVGAQYIEGDPEQCIGVRVCVNGVLAFDAPGDLYAFLFDRSILRTEETVACAGVNVGMAEMI